MAKNNVTAPEQEALGEALSKTENFFEANGKKIIYIIVALVIVAGAFFGYKEFVSKPKAEKASTMLYQSQQLLESDTPNYDAALNGDGVAPGFLAVIEEYKSTPAGNLAQHYAGACYLHLGDLDNAAAYLSAYEAVEGVPGEIINAQNLALQGDVAVEKGDYNAAVALFTQAAEVTSNNYTTPLYLNKAGLAARAAGDTATAKALFNRVLVDFPTSTEEFMKAEKFLGTL